MKGTGKCIRSCLLAVVLAAALPLSACGNGAEKTGDGALNTPGDKDSQTVQIGNKDSQAEQPEDKDTQKEQNKGDDWAIYKETFSDTYFDVPKYKELEKGGTELFVEFEHKYVSVNADPFAEAGMLATPEEAFEHLYPMFEILVHNQQDVTAIHVENSEDTEVNGIEVYQFEGTLECGRDYFEADWYDAYVYGYSFIYNGYPLMIIGSVLDKEQPQDQIDAVKEYVQRMMKSVRSEP